MARQPSGSREPRGGLSMVSLFTGAGGLDVGLEATGHFDLLACAELDPVFCDTLRLNRAAQRFGRSRTKILQADLSELDPFELMDEIDVRPGELDVLVGGPPCQTFSTAGRRQTVEDPRGLLIWHFLRFVEALRPRYFVMENVRGLLSAALRHRPIAARPEKGGRPLEADEEPGSVINAWVDDLAKIDNGAYRVDCFEVNAVNYGAPQLRERVLFIGNRQQQLINFPEPIRGPVATASKTGLQAFRTLGEALDGFHEDHPVLMDFSPRKKRYLELVPPGGNWRSLPADIARESMGQAYFAKGGRSGWWRRLSWDLPCPTIVTLPNHASTSMCHPDQIRVLSVGECARVQEFPDGWVFLGTPQQQMTQVGNAVPARLGMVAGELIAGFTSRHGGMADTSQPDPPTFRRVYLGSHVRTRQWWKSGVAYVWDGHGGSAEYGKRKRLSEGALEDHLPHVLLGANQAERGPE